MYNDIVSKGLLIRLDEVCMPKAAETDQITYADVFDWIMSFGVFIHIQPNYDYADDADGNVADYWEYFDCFSYTSNGRHFTDDGYPKYHPEWNDAAEDIIEQCIEQLFPS